MNPFLDLPEIAAGDAAQALAKTLLTPDQRSALTAAFQAEGGKGAVGLKTDRALPGAVSAQGDKGSLPAGHLPQAAAALGAKGPVTRMPVATAAQGTKTPPPVEIMSSAALA